MQPIVIDAIPDDVEFHIRNILDARKRNLPELLPIPSHQRKWCVCGGGPSLKSELGRIRKGKKKGEIIVSVNGTHDYLLEHGIKPDAFVMADAKQIHTKFLTNPQKGIVYYIGSHCHPDVFEALKGFDVRLWHALEYKENEYAAIQIGGGCTVGLRALNIGYALGFRNFHLFGFDGCVKESHHVYSAPEHDQTITRKVYFDSDSYVMTDWMIAQAQDFKEFLSMFGKGFRVTVHSPGIIQAMANIFYRGHECQTES